MKEIPLVNLIEILHLILLSIWGGIVITETVIELYPYREKKLHNSAISLHYYIDIFVECPVLFGVLLSGIFLALLVNLTTAHYIKIASGIIAISMNFTCIGFVIKRKHLHDSGADENTLWRYTRYVIRTAVIGVPAALVAIYLGLTLGYQRIFNLINVLSG